MNLIAEARKVIKSIPQGSWVKTGTYATKVACPQITPQLLEALEIEVGRDEGAGLDEKGCWHFYGEPLDILANAGARFEQAAIIRKSVERNISTRVPKPDRGGQDFNAYDFVRDAVLYGDWFRGKRKHYVKNPYEPTVHAEFSFDGEGWDSLVRREDVRNAFVNLRDAAYWAFNENPLFRCLDDMQFRKCARGSDISIGTFPVFADVDEDPPTLRVEIPTVEGLNFWVGAIEIMDRSGFLDQGKPFVHGSNIKPEEYRKGGEFDYEASLRSPGRLS